MTNTIYTILKDIFKTKDGTLHTKPDFNQALQSTYMLQRWISMDSIDTAHLVNETTNKLWIGLADDKELWYKLYLTLINKKNYHKISYIKRPKAVVSEKKEKMVEELANRNELSKREVEANLKLANWLEEQTKGNNTN